jgi:hypothetical protein
MSNRRPFGLRRALAWVFIRPSKEARMSNVLRNCT